MFGCLPNEIGCLFTRIQNYSYRALHKSDERPSHEWFDYDGRSVLHRKHRSRTTHVNILLGSGNNETYHEGNFIPVKSCSGIIFAFQTLLTFLDSDILVNFQATGGRSGGAAWELILSCHSQIKYIFSTRLKVAALT